jgi:hypothetical protein
MAHDEDRITQKARTTAKIVRSPVRRLPKAEPARSERVLGQSRFAGALDFVSDLTILAFASWTLIAYGGMATDANVTVLVVVWLATVPLLGAVLIGLSRRSDDPASRTRGASPQLIRPDPRRRHYELAVGLAGGLAFAILAAAETGAPWPVAWVGAFIAVGLTVRLGRLRSEEPSGLGPTPAWPAHVFAACVALGFAAMSLFINRPDEDDAFYVNRATATADMNRIPVRDVLFTDERLDPVSGTGLPVDSFAALQGALGRLLEIHAASVAYYVTPPLLTFLATWALWRLLRSWARRTVVLCFSLGCVYWLFSAQSGLTAGSFFLARMWQGKVVFVTFLVLTVYTYLTRWLKKRDAATAILLLATGVSSIGMTGSATFVAPLIFGAAAIPLVAGREWRGLPVLVAAAAVPVAVGLVATLSFPLGEGEGLSHGNFAHGTSWYFHEVLGVGVVVFISATGLLAAPWLARTGSASRLTTGIAVVSVLLLAPAVLPEANDLTELTRLLRRTLWVIPLPAVVGLLAALPAVMLLDRLAGVPATARRLAVAAPALLVAGLLVAFGHPLWISTTRNERPLWVSHPSWKTDQQALASARAILARYNGDGPILAEEKVMLAIALSAAHPKAVNPRSLYARFIPEPPQRTENRLALTRFMKGWEPMSSREVQRALEDLQVGLVCADRSRLGVIRVLEDTEDYRQGFQVRRLMCFQRRRVS